METASLAPSRALPKCRNIILKIFASSETVLNTVTHFYHVRIINTEDEIEWTCKDGRRCARAKPANESPDSDTFKYL